jgi:hypothetical protein
MTTMTTLLLTDQPDGSYVTPQHSVARAQLIAHLRAWRLDSALADGASPDASATLSLRAQRLIGQTTRRELALAIHHILHEAKRPTHPHTRVPICRRKVAQSASALEQLADRLLSPGAVDARGVAQVRLLLRDGTGPLYSRPQADDLEQPVRATIKALELRL